MIYFKQLNPELVKVKIPSEKEINIASIEIQTCNYIIQQRANKTDNLNKTNRSCITQNSDQGIKDSGKTKNNLFKNDPSNFIFLVVLISILITTFTYLFQIYFQTK